VEIAVASHLAEANDQRRFHPCTEVCETTGQEKLATVFKLLPYRDHKAAGKSQPTPANAREALVFENPEGGSLKRSLRPHGASRRSAVFGWGVKTKS
jgi:hypothetical protein